MPYTGCQIGFGAAFAFAIDYGDGHVRRTGGQLEGRMIEPVVAVRASAASEGSRR